MHILGGRVRNLVKILTKWLYSLSTNNREISKQKQKNCLLFRIQIFHVSGAVTRCICEFFVLVWVEYGIQWHENKYKNKSSQDMLIAQIFQCVTMLPSRFTFTANKGLTVVSTRYHALPSFFRGSLSYKVLCNFGGNAW